MIRLRKSCPARRTLLALVALFTAIQAAAALKTGDDRSRPAAAAADGEEQTAQLASEVREIAGSNLISRAKKEKRISTAVRVAVVAATVYRKDPVDALARAIELAETAAHAAPAFAEVVANAVSFAPSVSRLEGASTKIRSAAFAAAKGPGKGRISRTAQTARTRERSVPASESYAGQPAVIRVRSAPPAPVPDDPIESSQNLVASGQHATMDRNTRFSVSAAVGVRHDDNVYLTSRDEVGDTIFTLTPGVMFRYGQDSLAHGSLQYGETFMRYSGKSAPNLSLGAGAADFGYDNGNLSLAANAAFRQLNQNTNADTGTGLAPQIFRRDLLDLGLTGESPLTAKTRLRTGVKMNQMKYRNVGLVGTRQTELPLNVFLETTPKTGVGLGATYRWVKPLVAGPGGATVYPGGHDLYYNVVARGSFTPKLNGEVSVGYRTREVDVNPRENLWGFDGALNYDITGKSSLALQLSRDFSVGALGESLKTNRFTLRLASDPTLQWSLGAMLSYQGSDFGNREDRYWEGSLQTSYILTSWLTASADYSHRKNQSTLTDAHYANNLFNLTFGLRY